MLILEIILKLFYIYIYIEFQQVQLKERIIQHATPCKESEIIGPDVFSLYNNHYFCIVDYHSKF